jgi:hypothetical protein
VKRLIGIYREKEYSPGRHQSNDALLIEAIAKRLQSAGFPVELMTFREQIEAPVDAALVFSMCQGPAALEHLAKWERTGIRVINSPTAARNTYRDRLPALLQRAGVPFPHTVVVDTGAKLNGEIPRNGHLWLKRGDVHASVAADVQQRGSAEIADAVGEFHARGIPVAAVQAHCAGDEIKFYGVGGEFFHWFYSREANGYDLDQSALVSLARRSAAAAGLEIFGGDAIVGPSGELTLIDLNDWPSFAPCRDAASDAVAELITKHAHAG